MPLRCCCCCCLKEEEEEATEEEEAATELLFECQNGSLQRPQILPSDTDFSLASAIVPALLIKHFGFRSKWLVVNDRAFRSGGWVGGHRMRVT